MIKNGRKCDRKKINRNSTFSWKHKKNGFETENKLIQIRQWTSISIFTHCYETDNKVVV